MKIRIYTLAFDGNNIGTGVHWAYTKAEIYATLTDLLLSRDDSELFEAVLAAIGAEDFDKANELLLPVGEARCATWQIDHPIIDTEIAEVAE